MTPIYINASVSSNEDGAQRLHTMVTVEFTDEDALDEALAELRQRIVDSSALNDTVAPRI